MKKPMRVRGYEETKRDPFMSAEEFLVYIRHRGACLDAQNWVSDLIRHNKAKTGEDVWLQIYRSDWLDWLIYGPDIVSGGPISDATYRRVAHHQEITLRRFLRNSKNKEVAAIGRKRCVVPPKAPTARQRSRADASRNQLLELEALLYFQDSTEHAAFDALIVRVCDVSNDAGSIIHACFDSWYPRARELDMRLCDDIRHCISFEDMLLQYNRY